MAVDGEASDLARSTALMLCLSDSNIKDATGCIQMWASLRVEAWPILSTGAKIAASPHPPDRPAARSMLQTPAHVFQLDPWKQRAHPFHPSASHPLHGRQHCDPSARNGAQKDATASRSRSACDASMTDLPPPSGEFLGVLRKAAHRVTGARIVAVHTH